MAVHTSSRPSTGSAEGALRFRYSTPVYGAAAPTGAHSTWSTPYSTTLSRSAKRASSRTSATASARPWASAASMTASLTGTSPPSSFFWWRTAAGTITPLACRSSTTPVVAPTRSISRSQVVSRKACSEVAVLSCSATRYSSASDCQATGGAAPGSSSLVRGSSSADSAGLLGTGGVVLSKDGKLSSTRRTTLSRRSRAITTAEAMSAPRPKRFTPPEPASTISVSADSTVLGWRTTRVFSPTPSESPGFTGWWPVTGWPLSLLPLRLPRSSKTMLSPWTLRRAWRRETRSPDRTMSFSSARPSRVTPSGRS